MNITSAQYVIAAAMGETEPDHIIATIDGSEMIVPLDPDNRHYAAILDWVAEGNTIQEASD